VLRCRRFEIALVALLVVWVGIVIVAYYAIHKPFTLANALSIGEAAAGLAGAGLVAALGTGVGLLCMPCQGLTPAERLIWAAALGLGAVSIVGLGLGVVGLLRRWLLWLVAVSGCALTVHPLWRALRAAWADPAWRPSRRFEGLLAVFCGVALAVALGWALAPPTAWDSLVYHLTGPKLYLGTDQVSHPVDLPYLGFPQLVEMLFAWGMGLVGERGAAPIHWFYGVLAVLGLVIAGRRWLGEGAGWPAAAVLLAAGSVVLLAGWPYVDLALLLYATLTFLSLSRFCEPGQLRRRWLVLSGVFAGLALSTKYTALAILPASSLVLFVSRLSHPGPKARRLQLWIRDTLIFSACALLAWSPWLLKNFWLTGNPTYPFFLGGQYWDKWRAWWYDRPGTGLLYTAPWRLITAPWDATVWGIEGKEGYAATIGPLFLALLPFLLLTWRRLPPAMRRWLGTALVFSGALYGFWLWGVARTALLVQTRLLLPAFGLLALVVGAVLGEGASLPRRPVDVRWLVRAIVLLVLLLSLFDLGLGWVGQGPQRVLLGFEDRDAYLSRRLGWYFPAVQAVNQLPAESKVLFLWEPRSYHCQVMCVPDALLDRWLHSIHGYGHHADSIASAWQAEGVTHVLMHQTGYEAILEAGFDPLAEDDQVVLVDLLSGMVRLADFGGVYVLYAFPEDGRP
jgi:4-amino-4-deoxy-L-arabinose transferase-like glycosyltransferase